MSVSRISARYAKSLLDLARDRNELEVVKADVDFVKTKADIKATTTFNAGIGVMF